MSNLAVKNKAKDFFAMPVVQEKIKELVGKNASSFTTSVLQIVNSNSMLIDADPKTIFNAACMAATLNLPINNGLGFAYIVPFKNKGNLEAQFQIGAKGFRQLAIRSGQFERIATSSVYDGQLISSDPLLGYQFDWSVKPNGNAIGYVAFFKLLNGFTAELYMTTEQIQAHAKKYSQSFKAGYGPWKDNFPAMAEKTVLKLLLSKQAPLSIDMQKAELSDQTVIRDLDNDGFDYVDNTDSLKNVARIISDEDFPSFLNAIEAGDLSKEHALNSEIYALTEEQRKQVVSA